MQTAWSKLRRRKAWTDNVDAWMAVRETTGGADGQGVHAHLHLVVDADYWEWSEISELWSDVTGGESNVVDIRAVREGWEYELLKYPFKTAKLPDSRIVEFALGSSGQRTVSLGGAWYKRASSEDLDESGDSEYEFLTFGALLTRVSEGDADAVTALETISRKGFYWRESG